MREVGVAFTRAFPANDLQAIAADIVMEMFVYIACPACTDTSEIHIQIPTRSVGIVMDVVEDDVHHLHTYINWAAYRVRCVQDSHRSPLGASRSGLGSSSTT